MGGYFVWNARDIADQRDALVTSCTVVSPCSSAEVNDYDRRGRRANIIAGVGVGVGVAALATGIALFVLTKPEASGPVAIAPLDGGALVTGAFTW